MHEVLSSPSSARIHQEEMGDVCLYFQDSFREILYPKCYPACSLSLATSLTCATFSLKEEASPSICLAFFQLLHRPLYVLLCSSFSFSVCLFLVYTHSSTTKILCTCTQIPGEISDSILMVASHVAWCSGHSQNTKALPKQEQGKLLLTFC